MSKSYNLTKNIFFKRFFGIIKYLFTKFFMLISNEFIKIKKLKLIEIIFE